MDAITATPEGTTFDLSGFDKGNLITLCRELGLRKDWCRAKTAEIRAMLMGVSYARLRRALMAGGVTADEAEGMEIHVDDAPTATDEDEADDRLTAEELADYTGDDELEALPMTATHQIAVVPVAAGSTATQLADLFAKMMAQPGTVDASQVEQIVDAKLGAMKRAMSTAFDVSHQDIADKLELVVKAALAAAPKQTFVQPVMGEAKKVKGLTHAAFQRVYTLASLRQNVLLVGPAGCGKTQLAEQVADALGLPFSFLSGSAGMSESQLQGWLLPVTEGGAFSYVPSSFVTAYETGGVFLLDEIDAADENLLLVINAALANGAFAIPQRY